MSAIWSFGGTTNTPGRKKFDFILRMMMTGGIDDTTMVKYGIITKCYTPDRAFAVPLPEDGTADMYVFIKEGMGKWQSWKIMMDNSAFAADETFNSIIVPTIDTVRYTWLMDLLVTHQRYPCFVGPTGTGKSVYVNNYLLKKMDGEKYKPLSVNFSAQTTAHQVQDIIYNSLAKRRKGVYGPPVGQKMVRVDPLLCNLIPSKPLLKCSNFFLFFSRFFLNAC